MLVFFVAVYALIVLWLAPFELVPDSWLMLVAGREVAQHGLPAHDHLVVLAGGRRWIDQQWLAQLVYYGLVRAGGTALAVTALAAVLTGTLALAAAAARAAGASARSIVVVAAVAIVAAPSTLQLRAQSLAIPLFVALLWLLRSDARAPSRRLALLAPILVLWANLHGSVVVGVLLVWLYAASVVRRRPARAALVALAAPLALLATPYGLATAGYYARTLGGSNLAHYVEEWQPVTWTNGKPFLAFAVAVLWLVARHGRKATVFEQLVVVAMLLLSLEAVRNVVWFAAAAVVVAPAALDGLWSSALPAGRAPRPVVVVARATALAAVLAAAATPAFGAGRVERLWDDRAAAAAARPGGTVFTSDRYSDWLLWRNPALAGRVLFDARFELLTTRQLERLARGRSALALGARVAVLDRTQDARTEASLRAHGWSEAYRNAGLVVLRRPG
jgi:hypothetical protein